MAWHQISLITDENTAPGLADYFSELGAVSVTYMDAEDQPVYEPAIGATKIWRNTQVIALYEVNAEPALIKTLVYMQFDNNLLHDWRQEELADQEWERAWMDYYQPMKFADKLWVCPTDQQRSEPGTICLTLDPGLAFGTGTHPTTALCLQWLASHELTGKTVIDYGCGSGILAVAAILLGAKKVHAVDIDPQALTATTDNALKNHVQDKIQCFLPDHFSPFQADVVLANILAKPLIDLSRQISNLLVSGGRLVLSGILFDQAEAVMNAYKQNIAFEPPVQQEEWIRLEGIKY
ncbi:methylase for 50S ribosomal subunit protein L11 [Candidatus Methylobacter favarea]|uniref:Ribosomal protein L11 methyltransferase n=1 Tax=Candidatus Methylobacter favarea TaxID=2707345 RepID=A0A8S0XFB1_9GAMM|nr:50S ribosomal protein L11 methyltransferase [Candidatus Methylobacter favarea]CAA9890334.1 methylase for 50S ribosomal subunit protein L11 [Candidatus Methylobacter favarea]